MQNLLVNPNAKPTCSRYDKAQKGCTAASLFVNPNTKPTCSGYDEWQKGCAAAKVHVMPKAEPNSFEIYRSIDRQILDGFCRMQVC